MAPAREFGSPAPGQQKNTFEPGEAGFEFAEGEGQVVTPEKVSPYRAGKHSIGESIIAPVIRAARIRVHRLLVFWIQLVLLNFVVFGMSSMYVGMILGALSVFLVFPLGSFISRLVGANIVLSILVGGLVTAMLEGGLSYILAKWAARLGILYGAFYGASLTSYFSSEDKNTNLFWALISTLLLIAGMGILGCSSRDVFNCLETIRDFIGYSLLGAVMTIIVGLILSPLIESAIDGMEAYIDKFVDFLRGEN